MSTTQMLRASVSTRMAARPALPARRMVVRAAFTKKPPTPPKKKQSLKPKQAGAADPSMMTQDKRNDFITHTIAGEHDMTVFVLLFMVLPFVPIFAPGFVWLARAMTGY